jgi:cell division septum initiation protein DivIVA
MDDDKLANIERGIAELKSMFEQRFDAVDRRVETVDRRFDEMHTEMDRRFDETQGQMKALIDDVRDDVRIVLEGHVALERRVTELERRER